MSYRRLTFLTAVFQRLLDWFRALASARTPTAPVPQANQARDSILGCSVRIHRANRLGKPIRRMRTISTRSTIEDIFYLISGK
jgi:hypothetical protein